MNELCMMLININYSLYANDIISIKLVMGQDKSSFETNVEGESQSQRPAQSSQQSIKSSHEEMHEAIL